MKNLGHPERELRTSDKNKIV